MKIGKDGLFFLPQRPYMVIGSLKDQITYPHIGANNNNEVREEELKKVLEMVDLEHIIDRVGDWNAVFNWEDILSLGEQQRIAMARLFYHKPLVAILDECTSALNVDHQEKCKCL